MEACGVASTIHSYKCSILRTVNVFTIFKRERLTQMLKTSRLEHRALTTDTVDVSA